MREPSYMGHVSRLWLFGWLWIVTYAGSTSPPKAIRRGWARTADRAWEKAQAFVQDDREQPGTESRYL